MQRIIPYGGMLYEGEKEVAQHIKNILGEHPQMRIKAPAKTSFDRSRSIVANVTIYDPGEEKIHTLFIPTLNISTPTSENQEDYTIQVSETSHNILHRALPAEIGLETKPGGYSIITTYRPSLNHEKTIFWVRDFTGVIEEDLVRQKQKNPKWRLPFWINIDEFPLIYDKESAPQLYPANVFLRHLLEDLTAKCNSLENYFIQKELKRCIKRVERVIKKMPLTAATNCAVY